jgi:nitroreductase
MAACPESAITIPALDPNQHNFSTFALDPAWLAPGKGLPTQDLALIGSSPGATCPKEDALLAAGNILLAAHTMGLGTCLIGYAVAAMAEDRSIQKKLGIPESETIHAAVALGYSDETFQRITGRKQPTIRFR